MKQVVFSINATSLPGGAIAAQILIPVKPTCTIVDISFISYKSICDISLLHSI